MSMRPIDPAAVEEIFLEALELDPEEWSAFLDARCPNAAVEEEVRSLLAHAGDDAPLPHLDETPTIGERLPERIGPYRIVRLLGQGGMGMVLLAVREGEGFEQTVALKLLPARWVDPLLIARFETERRLLAELEHPGIARLIDGGVTEDGHPFYAMEYVAGVNLLEYADAHTLGLPQRLELFIQVCEALHHAHEKLVVHRDLKPSNILVDATGRPRLLDFGIAKRLEDREGDPTVNWVTPAYASPEQVLGQSLTTRSDVYSLGVLLCELVAGGRPYATRAETPAEFGRLIEQTEPRRPSTVATQSMDAGAAEGDPVAKLRGTSPERLVRHLRGDLDTIVLKALAKDPERRYSSAAALAEDLRRHLDSRPIEARADGALYTLGKFVGRHRGLVASIALLALALVGGSAGIAWQARRAMDARDLAREEADRAQLVTAIMTDLFRLGDPNLSLGDTIGVRQVLDEGTRRVEDQLAGEPVLQASLFLELGRVYRNLGVLDEAEALGSRALQLRAETLPDSPEHADALGFLGVVLRDLSRPSEAVEYLDRALTMRRARGVTRDSVEAVLLHEMGWAVRDLGEHARANALMTEALELKRAVLGPDHPSVATTLLGLAATLHDQGSFDEAEALLQDAIDRGAGDRPTPSMAALMTSVGMIRRLRGQYEEADRFLSTSMTLHERLFGPDHPATVEHLKEYAVNLVEMGRYSEGRALLNRSLEIAIRTLGEDHVHTRGAREALAVAEMELGSYATASARLDSVLIQKTAALGPDHPGLVFTLILLGEMGLAVPDHAEAEAAFLEALSTGERAGDTDGVYGARARRGLAEIHLVRGEITRADSLLTEAESILARELRPGHRFRLDAARTRAKVLLVGGEAATAISLLRETLEQEARSRPTPHPRKGHTLALLHAAYTAMGDEAAAEEARRAALAEFADLAPSHPARRGVETTAVGG